MRVLLLGAYPPPHGGVQRNVADLRAYLLARGISCEVVNLSRHRREEHDGIHYPSGALGTLRRMLAGYDLLHLHIGGKLTLRLLGLSLACTLVPGARSVLTFHSGGYPGWPEGRTAGRRTLRGFVFRRMDRIIAVNEQIAELFRRFGVPAGRIRLIPPYALPGEWPQEPLPPRLREFYESHSPVLLTVGLLEPEYDLAMQVRCLARWRRDLPRAGLVIVGSGSLEEELKVRIAGSPCREHVLLCGDLPHTVTLRAMAEADVLLRTTLYDGDAISVREALWLGIPVVATDTGMRPPGVRLVALGDEEGLATAIQDCLRSGKRPPQPAAVPPDNLAQVLELYQELLPLG